MDPKSFYDVEMPRKYGADYESARWRATPLLAAQFGMMQEVVSAVARGAAGAASVIEVGPGPGTWTKFLLRENPGAAYTLVDISSEMLGQARAALGGAHAQFVESDLLEYEGASADFFFSSRAIEYVDDKAAAARKVAALLRPGGSGVIITKMPKPFLDRLRGRRSALHAGQIAPGALAAHLKAAGLSVSLPRIATATVPGLSLAALNRFAFWLLRPIPLTWPLTLFAESYEIAFKKPL